MALGGSRDDVPHLDVTWPLDRVLEAAAAASHLRWVPLSRGGIDNVLNVLGAVWLREVIAAKASGEALADLAMWVWFAPDFPLPNGEHMPVGSYLHPLIVYVDESGRVTRTGEWKEGE
jgi:hypothetical protein